MQMTQALVPKELTSYLKSFDWPKKASNESEKILMPTRGLYILVFCNNHPIDVHDRNKKKGSANVSGKRVVPSNACVVKFGKFEQHFVKRMKGYHDHMHYVNSPASEPSESVFSDLLVYALVLGLDNTWSKSTKTSISPANVFEAFWNSSWHSFLEESGQLIKSTQFSRSEYRLINAFDENVKASFSNQANDLCCTIERMAKACEE